MPSSRSVRPLIVFCALAGITWSAAAQTTWYVDDNAPNDPGPGNPGVSDPLENGSAAHPFDEIQEGIDAASNDDTVIVLIGTYYENVSYGGKRIVVRSSEPTNPDVVGLTVIDGGANDAVVTFAGTEDSSAQLLGFTIRNGAMLDSFVGYGGGVSGSSTQAKIAHCDITNNVAQEGGGGLANCDGVISDCTIYNNTTYGDDGGGGLFGCDGAIERCYILNNDNLGPQGDGGGVSACGGLIAHCTISGNYAGWWGGGLVGCDGTIASCVIADNTSEGGGGGLSNCDATIISCVIAGNVTTGYQFEGGGGLYECDGDIINCSIVENTAQGPGFTGTEGHGGGLLGCDRIIVDCIIWDNEADYIGDQLYDCSTPTYSCIELWIGGGTGNITDDPDFVNPGIGDYHLSSRSPCINAGDPRYNPGPDVRDIDNQLRIWGGRVDIGADEYGSRCPGDTDGDNDIDLADLATLLANYGQTTGMSWNNGDFDGDGDVDLADLATLLASYGVPCG